MPGRSSRIACARSDCMLSHTQIQSSFIIGAQASFWGYGERVWTIKVSSIGQSVSQAIKFMQCHMSIQQDLKSIDVTWEVAQQLAVNTEGRVVVLHPCTKFEVRWPCRSKDIVHDVCQH